MKYLFCKICTVNSPRQETAGNRNVIRSLGCNGCPLMGDAYISKPVQLAAGTYAVTDFMLVLGDDVLYATPQADSELAGQEANPLHYSFTVSSEESMTLDAEVLSTEGASTAQFGYVAFDISGIQGRLIPLLVFMSDQNGVQQADDVEALILENAPFPFPPDTLGHFYLENGKGEIPFDLDPRKVYKLVVARHGFTKYAENFLFSNLEKDFAGGSLMITLTPAFTYVASGSSYTRGDIQTDTPSPAEKPPFVRVDAL